MDFPNCYVDLSQLIHGFVKVVIGQQKNSMPWIHCAFGNIQVIVLAHDNGHVFVLVAPLVFVLSVVLYLFMVMSLILILLLSLVLSQVLLRSYQK